MKRFLYLLVAFATVSVLTMNAEVLLVEDFDYSAADAVLTDNGWFTQWEAPSPIQVTSGLEFNEHPGSGIGYAACLDLRESNPLHKSLSSEVSSGAVYFSFLFEPTIVGKASWFMALRDALVPNDYSSFNMNARVLVNTNNQIGLTFADNKKAVYAFNMLDQSQVYLIVVKYQIVEGANNDVVSLYLFDDYNKALVEPEAALIGPLSDAANVDINPANVILRGFDNNSTVVVDAIRCGTSWSDVVPLRGCTPVENAVADGSVVVSVEGGIRVGVIGDSNSVVVYDVLGHSMFADDDVVDGVDIALNKGIYVVSVNGVSQKVLVK